MSRFKTIFFWSFVLLAVSSGVLAYIYLKNSKKPQISALSVMPDSCLVYINTGDFFELNKKVNSQSLIADKLNLFPEVNFVLSTLQEFDSLFNSHELLREELDGTLFHFALYPSGFLLSFNLKQLGDEEKISAQLLELFQALKTEEGHFRFRTGTNKVLYFNLQDGVVLVSDVPLILKKAVDKAGSKLEQNNNFNHFKSTLNDDNLASFYVDHAMYESHKRRSGFNLNRLSKKGVLAGSIDFKPSEFIFNGFVKPDSTELLSYLSEQNTQASKDLSGFLPFNTVYFQAYALSSFPALINHFKSDETSSDFWNVINEKALYNLKMEFENNAGTHLVAFETAISQTGMISLEITDTLKALEHLKLMSDSLILEDSIPIYRIQRVHKQQALSLFDPLLKEACHYASLNGSDLYFSESKEAMLQTIKDLRNRRLLSQNQSFVTYMNQQFSDEYNLLFYTSPNLLRKKIPLFFDFKTGSESDPFLNFKHFSSCLTKNSGSFKFRLHVLHESENTESEPNVLWTLKLDTTAIRSAEGFVNHVTGENELLIQDENNTLYLINAKGTILWKKKLSEKIISKIFTVDIYKNNKYQLLFNTSSALHLIDRNGNYVESYPVELAAEASAPLNVFDYDGDKDYRILIACKNNLIYNYTIHGTKQEKFSIVKTENEVQLPIQYVKIGLSDYLVSIDREGKIYTFSRKGLGRIGLRNRAVINCKGFYCDLNNSINSSYIVYLDDKNALINKISFDDRKEIVKLDSETEQSTINFRLIDDNRSMDLLLTKENTIWSYNFSGNLISENSSEVNLSTSDFYKDESHAFYYSLSEDQQEIILQDVQNQKTLRWKGNQMPLISNLFKDNKKYLILSNGAQLSCVPIN